MHTMAETWMQAWAESLRSAKDLVQAGLIPPEDEPKYEPVLQKYRMVLPRYYAELIDRNNPHCPIRLQAIPSLDELVDEPTLLADPLRDLEHQPLKGVTHRYRNRALVHLTPNCSMYCRYCFRKSLLNELQPDFFGLRRHEVLAYLQEHTEVEEVILSGGDPWMLTDASLEVFFQGLEGISHIKRLRVHTRVPVTFPERVTENLAQVNGRTRFPMVVVTHFNHPKELTAEAHQACTRLKQNGITLLNQSVLLKNVNDNASTLKSLMEGLFNWGVLPYYLHHPDPAAGTGYFSIEKTRGLEIHETLQRSLPGYLVPKYVEDLPNQPYKTAVRL